MLHLILAVTSGFLSGEEPLPDPVTLMKEVQAHQQKMDELRDNYTYHRIRRVEELDGKGAVKKTTIQEREVFYVNGHQIGRLVKKEDRPLTEAEDKAEQERVRKLGENLGKKPAAFGKGGGVNLITMVLAVSEASNLRRAELNGRATLVFDFKGNPKAEAHGMESNAAKKLEGTVWIDETDRQVARLEVEFYDNFRIAGGLLASIQKGTVIQVDQSPIGEGLWMQTATEQHMNLRVIVKGFHENVYVTSFDFKRFNVDASASTAK